MNINFQNYYYSVKIRMCAEFLCRQSCSLISALLIILIITAVFPGCSTFSSTDIFSPEELFDFKVVEFRGRTFVLGGYTESGNSEKQNKQVFEIKDSLKAFYYKNGLMKSSGFSGISLKEFRASGNITIEGTLPEYTEFIEFNNRMYMIGGKRENRLRASVYVSDDMLRWKPVCRDAPWENGEGIVRHKLAVFNGMLYLSGGGVSDAVWRSSDGIKWAKSSSLKKDVRKLFVWNGNLYLYAHDGNSNVLFTTSDGEKWVIENGFPQKDNLEIVFSDKNLFAAVSHSVYSSGDGKKWNLIINSPAINTPCGMYNEKLYIAELEGLTGPSFSSDGINWESAENGAKVSLIPYDMGKDGLNNYDDFSVLEFNNTGWIIGESPERVYKSADGMNWKKVNVNSTKRFVGRSKGAMGVLNGSMYIAGGVWTGSFKGIDKKYYIVMNDIWRSRDGINWNLLTENAPWDKMMNAVLVTFQNRFILFGGDRYGGNGTVFQVWESSDGVSWIRNTDKEKMKTLAESDIRNSFIGTAVLNGKIYLSDKHVGYDIISTPDGKKYTQLENSGDTKELNIRLKNCVTIKDEGKEYMILKDDDEFFITSDFKRWEKLGYSYSSDYKGTEAFDDFILFKIGEKLFLTHPSNGDKTTIESISMKLNIKKNSVTFTKYNLSQI